MELSEAINDYLRALEAYYRILQEPYSNKVAFSPATQQVSQTRNALLMLLDEHARINVGHPKAAVSVCS